MSKYLVDWLVKILSFQITWLTFTLVSVGHTTYLQSRPANPEDDNEQSGWEQLPYKEDGAEDQVAFFTQFIT